VDITKCANEKCSKKGLCLRYAAKPEEYQSYAVFKEGEDCFVRIEQDKISHETRYNRMKRPMGSS